MKKGLLFFLICSLLFSCSNKTDVKFMGENLNTPCEDFEKHLKDNGFTLKQDDLSETPRYKGEYLDEEVSISLMQKTDGHYKELMLTAIIMGDNDRAKHYYKKLCKEVKKEHSGFEEEDDESVNGVEKMVYYSEEKGLIKILYTSMTSPMALGTVIAIYDTGEKYEED